MTPADEITAAVTRLRALLADPQLTPGPWLSMDHGDRVLWDGPGADDLPPRYVVDEPMSNGANADYLAAMHPNVGRALADWLDEEAELHSDDEAAQTGDGTAVACENFPHALAVARAINDHRPTARL